jgi:bifunctional DNase/RNase
MADGITEMVVESVRVHGPSGRHVVILKDTTRERYLPIWIGPWEASAIAASLQGMAPERPLTHDLFAGVLDELGVRLERVVVAELASETFHARLHLGWLDRTVEIDARPSDAIALAVRAGCPVFAADAVLAQAGVQPGEGEAPGGAPPGGHPLETTGETIVDPRLDVFREFVNSLDNEAEGGASR